MGVGGISVLFERKRTRLGEEFFKIKGEGESGLIFNPEVSSKLNAGEVLIVGEVVYKAVQFFWGGAKLSFESEKDVAASPVPMKIVEVGIERMIGRVLGRVSIVFFLGNSETETEGLVSAGRNLLQSKGGAAGRGVDEGKLSRKFLPAAVFVLQGRLAN